MDSARNLNVKFASSKAKTLNCTLESVTCYQQNNGFECGLNVLINAKLILHYFCPKSNNNKNFLKWFDTCTPCTSKVKTSLVTDVPKNNSSANFVKVPKTCVSESGKDKIALRLRKVDSNTWHIVKTNTV